MLYKHGLGLTTDDLFNEPIWFNRKIAYACKSNSLTVIGDTVGRGPGILTAVLALLINTKECKKYMNLFLEVQVRTEPKQNGVHSKKLS
jgi:hypothetical protein